MRDALPEHGARCRAPVLLGDVPVLDPQRLAVHVLSYSQLSPAANTSRADVRRAASVFTAALAQRETGPLRQHDVGHDAGAHHHRLGGDARARRGDDRGHATAGALEALDVLAGVDLDAVLLEHVLEEAPGTRTEPARSTSPPPA